MKPRIYRLDSFTPAEIARFWAKVQKSDGCWIWTGARIPNGYGSMGLARLKVGQVGAHRISYALAYGDPGKRFVCHTCDNPPCVNPAHLFLGSHRDNSGDMVSKGRSCQGSRHGAAKLTESDVAEIKDLIRCGYRNTYIGRLFGVDHSNVSIIRRGRGWAHVK